MNAVTRIAAPAARYEERLLRIAEVRRRTGLSVATIYRRKAAGTFPAAIELGPRMVAWYQSDIERWIADPRGYGVDGETDGLR